MSAPKAPKQPRKGDQIDLTPDDESALDKAMDTITDADIEASIVWLDSVASDKAQPGKPKRRRDPLDDL